MTLRRVIQAAGAACLLLALALLAGEPAVRSSPAQAPEDVQSHTFSLLAGGPLGLTGVHPADLMAVGGIPLIACEDLGLFCEDLDLGIQDELSSLSFGVDFSDDTLPPVQFSVAPGAQGTEGSAVRLEAGCSPAEPQADVFSSSLSGANSQDLDGDGEACATNSGYGLLIEEAADQDVDALAADPCRSIDFNCDGLPDEPVYFTLSGGSPTLALLDATPADILVAGSAYLLEVWASGNDQLGLADGDSVDALCLSEDGDGLFGDGDRLLISLAPGSPSLATIGAGAADLLYANPPRVYLTARDLGLLSDDDVDALLCGAAFNVNRLYLPVIQHR
ncbi:MAG: hypothetical protein L0Z70_15040 [Chloroflexi bacterium]|nr:hypothetical protein [Chloroflexota bacterium]